ncbi:MAG TPA: class II glutamine amidotransferase [Acidimicrobiales bacterium]|nr:class II glutamine amidotransferase [Acidimicrobiales bacterium]
MCEILVVTGAAPRTFSTVVDSARSMEYYGSANFGWGVAWLENGRVEHYRSVGRLRDEADAAERLGPIESTHFLVHFRRPSKLSTIQMADTQPFLDEGHALAFAHNGRFVEEAEYRPTYADHLLGAADSEVGFAMFQDLLAAGAPMGEALETVHSKLGGRANLVAMDSDGRVALYSSYEGNRLWTFRDGDAMMAATELHSPDGSLFDLIFPNATKRRVVEGSGTL